jgi:hypothetical protein
MKDSISIKYKVAMFLIQLKSENSLQQVDDLLGITKSIFLVVLKEFCYMVRLYLQILFVQFPCKSQFKVFSKKFETLHGIS